MSKSDQEQEWIARTLADAPPITDEAALRRLIRLLNGPTER